MRRLACVVVVAMLAAGCASGGAGGTLAQTTAPAATPSPATTAATAPPSSLQPTEPLTPATTEPPAPGYDVPPAGNLGLAAEWVVGLEDGAALGVSEAAQGRDLNGDGDRDDVLAYAVTGDRVVTTGIVATWGVEPLDGGGFSVELWEGDAGRDLDGDGDTSDAVPQLWTDGAGVVNVGLPGWIEASYGSWLWLAVYEAWEGSDLNGDGVVGTASVAFRMGADGRWLNTRWAVGTIVPLDDGSALFGVFESEQGDVNEDGDTEDHVAVWWRGPGDAEVIAPDAYVIRATSDGGAYITWGETDGDLNGDGVVSRWNMLFWHPVLGRVDLPISTVCQQPTPDGGVIFRVAELPDYWSNGEDCATGTDRNGDGDCNDFILGRWSRAAGLVDLELAQEGWCPECSCGYLQVGERVLATSWATAGKGETPTYPDLFVVEGNRVRDLGVTVGWGMAWAEVNEGAVLTVPEQAVDLNGDGDTDDTIFHLLDFDGAVTSLGLAGGTARTLSGGRALLLVDEAAQGADLNGDGRITAETLVPHLWDPELGLLDLQATVAQWTDEFDGTRPSATVELPGNRLLVLVPEWQHGRGDLNGDGDTDDDVVHVVVLPTAGR